MKEEVPNQSSNEDKENKISDNNLDEEVITAFKASGIEEDIVSSDGTDSMLKMSPPSDFKKNIAANAPSKVELKPKTIESIFSTIESAMPKDSSLSNNTFPHPRNWLGPRFIALWGLPILLINKSRSLIDSTNPIREYSESEYKIGRSETIYTAAKQGLEGKHPMRFFGARFLTIWVLPLAITGTIMEFLFVSPLTGVKPFG